MSQPTVEQLAARIKELEEALKPKPRKPRKYKGLPNGKINFTFMFGR
jgi:hypothetical protein